MKNLNQYRWQQVDTLFNEVLDLPPEKRKAFLTESCGADTDLKNHVEKLLQIHEEAKDILGDSAGTFVGPLLPGLLDEVVTKHIEAYDDPGSTVGHYQILEKIGRGGMGTVYLAKKKDAPYNKKVALKVVRKGLDTRDTLRRFQRESQILASIEHPNIARLYDGGIHNDGRPFVVMEYIEGEPIDIYCNRHKLSIKKRLKLFKTVCEAVHYAHQGLIIHRDIKPANVLVTPDGVIKLVDFGIAKLLEPDSMDSTGYHTQTGMKLMTPEFAAPEQIQDKAITTASDIYGLGVLLYLLVTGRHPYRLGTASMLEIERIICESTPLPPSEAVTGRQSPLPANVEKEEFDRRQTAQLRGRDPESLRRELTGDVDQIILKALRKEPGLRYRSALGFAEDLENYLKGRPVQARPATLWYRTRKLIQRNRWVAAAAAVAVFSVLTGLGVALWQANVAGSERDIAQREAAKAQAAQDYLVDLFETADPAKAQGEQITIQQVIQRGINRLEEDLGSQPEVHIEMLKVLGRVEQSLGDFDLSAELLEKALSKTIDLRGEHHPDVAAVSAMLGEVMRWKGEFNRAETLLRDALDIHLRYFRDDNPEVAINMDRLARTLEMAGKEEEAEDLYRQALAIRTRLFGENSDAVSANLNNLGWLLYQRGKLDESDNMLRKSLEIKEQILEPPHPAIASNLGNLAVVLRTKGNYKDAEYYSSQALEQEIKLHGEDHPRVTTALNNLTLILLDVGRYEEATSNYRQILENNRRQLGPDHLYVGFSLCGLSKALIEDGRSKEALPLLDEAIDVFRISVGEEHRYYALGLYFKGNALYHLNPDQAIPLLERSVDIYKRAIGEEHSDFARTLTTLGRTHFAVGKIDEAEYELRKALDIQRRVLPAAHSNTIWTLLSLAKVLLDRDRQEEAEPLLIEAVEASVDALPAGHWRQIEANLELAACLKAKGSEIEARKKIEKISAELQGRTDFHATRLQTRARELNDIRF